MLIADLRLVLVALVTLARERESSCGCKKSGLLHTAIHPDSGTNGRSIWESDFQDQEIKSKGREFI